MGLNFNKTQSVNITQNQVGKSEYNKHAKSKNITFKCNSDVITSKNKAFLKAIGLQIIKN